MLAPQTQRNLLTFLKMKEGRILIGVLLFVAVASPMACYFVLGQQSEMYKGIIGDKNETIRLERAENKIYKADARFYQKEYVEEVKSHAREMDSIKEMFKKVIDKK